MTRSTPVTVNPINLVLDLGGVLFHPQFGQVKLATHASPISVKRLVSTSTWMAYECGKLSEKECYQQLADQYGFQADDLAIAITKGRAVADYDRNLVASLRDFKNAMAGKVVFILASNISSPDYIALQELWGKDFWSLFDHCFPSSTVGTRKPSMRFYRHILGASGAVPEDTIFVDDRPENVLAASAMGVKGIVFTDGEDLLRSLMNMTGDPVERGQTFLQAKAGQHCSITDRGEQVKENYSQLLMLDITGDSGINEIVLASSLVSLNRPPRFWNFFAGAPKFTTDTYPDDLDTTSLALASMPYEASVVHSILDEMLNSVDEDGLLKFYLDDSRPRVDAVICLNILTLFCIYKRGYQLPETLSWIYDILLNRAYMHGTRYYTTPEWFLYYMSRLLSRTNDPILRDRFENLLRTRIMERIGAEGDALCLAMRLNACNLLGISNRPDFDTLTAAQCRDGGWGASLMYIIPGSSRKLGNRGLTTAFAVKALQGAVDRLN
ncbi:HAD-superfamily hydrolase subfamily IA variant 3 [Penicillium coprophilum]|uniref:HAD-superfamily hydrolase subfamily IA variant 3 n=1 Tax=Penicillium coprophilum TaxID=36646 RepID=UPI0023A6E9A2|nr:HAD-superfamily hydrolase subfamily IA variant 3 [Penicillium coprophilum]KAJ5164534.1 HAD-superfamily hydrolase subfamily IA variant 3 [Penicillium coprophilum]